MRRVRSLAALLVGACCALAEDSRAQGLEPAPAEAIALNLDLAVPESPAFTALGLTPDIVSRPATPRELAASLLSGLDQNGNFQAGVALDTVPYLLFWGDSLTLREYRRRPEGFNWRRQAARFEVSLGSTKGTDDDDESVRLGLGLRATPWSRADPRLDDHLVRCFKRVASTLPGRPASEQPFEEMPTGDLTGGGPGDPMAAIERYFEQVDDWERVAIRRSEACAERSEKRLAKGSGWSLGAAPTWIQRDGTDDDPSWGGGTLWTSLAYGFEEWLQDPKDEQKDRRGIASQPQLIAHLRLHLDERMANEEAPSGFVRQDRLVAGARLRIGGDDFPISIEAAYQLEDRDERSTDHSFRGSVSADVHLYDQVWLGLGIGGSTGRDQDRVQLGATLKWGGQRVDLPRVVGLFD